MSRAGANSSARGQSVAQAQHPEGREPSAAAPPHAATTAAYLHGLDSEAAARFERGKAKRRALFLQYAETEYIDALDSVSVVERMEALQKITAVFEPDPEATTDDTMLGLQEKAITATLELLVQEDMPRAQALGFRALLALYPAPPKVPAPPKKDPKEKPKSKFAAAPKRAPPGRRSGAKAAGDAKSTHPKILECVAPKRTPRAVDAHPQLPEQAGGAKRRNRGCGAGKASRRRGQPAGALRAGGNHLQDAGV